MKITKIGSGVYKCPSDLAKIGITLTVQGFNQEDWNNLIPKEELIDKFLLRYKIFNDKLQEFLTENNIDTELYFNRYSMYKVNKPRLDDNDPYISRFDITGYYSMDISIAKDKNNLTKLIEFFTSYSKEFNNIELKYDISFTLSETARDIAKGKATTIALSHIKEEIKEIAAYLGVKNMKLTHIDFTNNNPYSLSTGRFSKSAINSDVERASLSKEERIDILDKMLNTKDIETYISFTSIWELS